MDRRDEEIVTTPQAYSATQLFRGHSEFGVGDKAPLVIDSPNGHIMNSILDNGETAEITVPLADGREIRVYRWGGYNVSTGEAPSGLVVQLKDGGETVVAKESTVNTESNTTDAPVASYTNGTGSREIVKLAVKNGTGSTIGQPGVGAIFGYVLD